MTPRLTPAGSRSEATVATLDMARRSGRPQAQLEALDRSLRRSLALLLRHQLALSPGVYPSYLMAEPEAVDGAVPGSEVDWALRIDYAQHAGNALLHWAEPASAATNVQAEQPGESLRIKSW